MKHFHNRSVFVLWFAYFTSTYATVIEENDELSFEIQGSSASTWALENLMKQAVGEAESASGPGSSLMNTVVMRSFLSSVVERYAVKTVVDIGCGDWNWMRTVNFSDLGIGSYTGYDVSKEIIERNSVLYANDTVRFRQLNILTEPPDSADLVIVRDLLFHLSNTHILQALHQICESASRLLITTTFPLLRWNTDLSARRRTAHSDSGMSSLCNSVESGPVEWGSQLMF